MGFKLNKKTNQCEKVVITCPKGTKKVGDKCIRPLICRKGYKKVGNKCVLDKCPKGFKKVKDECVKIIVKITCPKNTVYDKKKNVCVQKVFIKITCGKGFKLNKKTNKCEKVVFTCPKGTKKVG